MPYGTLALDAISTSGNLSVTGNTVTTGALVATNMPGRNRLINGAMAVDQRNSGASQTIVSSATTAAYTVDRWYAYSTGANVTGQQVTGSVSNTYRYQFTGAASVTAIGFGQRIEALNSADLAGTTATLSVDLANTVLTTVTWTAFYANTTNTFGNISAPTRTQMATGTFTVTSTVTRYSAPIAVPAAATTGIDIVFSVGAQTSGTWTIGNAQLEAGAFATPFERRLIGQELLLCQRYYYRIASSAGSLYTNVGVGRAYSGTNGQAIISLPVSMRAVPTLAYSALTDWNIAQSSGNITVMVLTLWSTDFRQISIDITAAFNSGQVTILNANNTANAWMSWAAEL